MTEEQKIAELLKPRYEVITDYPGSAFSKGDILYQYHGAGKVNKNYWTLKRGGLYDIYPHSYKAIFKPLQWWERREAGEMPEYVKDKTNQVLKVIRHFSDSKGGPNGRGCLVDQSVEEGWPYRGYSGCEPATLSDYNNFIQIQKEK